MHSSPFCLQHFVVSSLLVLAFISFQKDYLFYVANKETTFPASVHAGRHTVRRFPCCPFLFPAALDCSHLKMPDLQWTKKGREKTRRITTLVKSERRERKKKHTKKNNSTWTQRRAANRRLVTTVYLPRKGTRALCCGTSARVHFVLNNGTRGAVGSSERLRASRSVPARGRCCPGTSPTIFPFPQFIFPQNGRAVCNKGRGVEFELVSNSIGRFENVR